MEEVQGVSQPDGKFQDGQREQLKIKLTSDLVEMELKRVKHKRSYGRVLKSTLGALIAVMAAVVLIVVLLLPVLQISGDSMTETLHDGDIVVAIKGSRFETGDVIAFYHGNDILLKRVIACAGQWVDMDTEGNVYVDNVMLDEPYVTDKALGDCNITLPCQVPEGRMFVLGDHRLVSIDSRNDRIGCVEISTTVGKVAFCVWPLSNIGLIN